MRDGATGNLFMAGNSTIQWNDAGGGVGGKSVWIWWQTVSLWFIPSFSIFDARRHAGALCVLEASNASISMSGMAILAGNAAGGSGGAVYVAEGENPPFSVPAHEQKHKLNKRSVSTAHPRKHHEHDCSG